MPERVLNGPYLVLLCLVKQLLFFKKRPRFFQPHRRHQLFYDIPSKRDIEL